MWSADGGSSSEVLLPPETETAEHTTRAEDWDNTAAAESSDGGLSAPIVYASLVLGMITVFRGGAGAAAAAASGGNGDSCGERHAEPEGVAVDAIPAEDGGAEPAAAVWGERVSRGWMPAGWWAGGNAQLCAGLTVASGHSWLRCSSGVAATSLAYPLTRVPSCMTMQKRHLTPVLRCQAARPCTAETAECSRHHILLLGARCVVLLHAGTSETRGGTDDASGTLAAVQTGRTPPSLICFVSENGCPG